jgi:WD40 repeat protein
LARIGGTSYAVAYYRDILVTGRGDSFVVYGTGKACRGRGADPCRLVAPERAFSDAAVESLVLKRYGPRLLLASTGERNGRYFFNLWDLTAAAAEKVVHLSSSRPLETWIGCLALSPRYPLIAAGAGDGKTRVWDVSDPRHPQGIRIRHARGNENQAVDAIAFSRDGSLLASGGDDQQVVLWKVSRDGSGRVAVERTPGTLLQGQSILALAFSPSGDTLAAGDAEGVTCLYDVATRREIGSDSCLLGHDTELIEGGIDTVKIARLGGETVLLTAGAEQPIVAWSSVLWNGSHAGPVERTIADDACALAHRNLTENEWSSVFASTELADQRDRTCPRYPLP